MNTLTIDQLNSLTVDELSGMELVQPESVDLTPTLYTNVFIGQEDEITTIINSIEIFPT